MDTAGLTVSVISPADETGRNERRLKKVSTGDTARVEASTTYLLQI
jgi:hypothetical protein